MTPKPQKPKPFDVKFTDEELTKLAHDLCLDIDNAISARSSVTGDGGLIDLCDWFYEQGRTEPADRPFPGAADLTSYFVYEKVSSLRARLMKAIFGVRPFCFVEGWGQDAHKAPYVEAFTDWQVRKGGLPLELYKAIHGGLIEDAYILEVSEKTETRRVVEETDAALAMNELNAPILGEDNKPQIQSKPDGEPVPAQQGQPAATIKRDYVKTKRLGPQYDAISMKDFVYLPSHAKNQAQTYGHAYRTWVRTPDLDAGAKDGIYDKDAVKIVREYRDRELSNVPPPVDTVGYQEGPTIETELFQLSLKRDLDGDGREEWYLLTLHIATRTILRCKLDVFCMKVGMSRCVPFVFFPRRNSVYGYSYAEAILPLAEEDTALRNNMADRGNLALNAPVKRLRTAHWDPNAQPIGVGRVIDVNDMNEMMPMVMPDVPVSAVNQRAQGIQAVERVSGLADSAVGVLSQETRTLGEQRLVAGGSAVRVDEVMGHLHRSMSDVIKLAVAIWVETLKGDSKGLDAPESVMGMLQSKGADFNGTFTADMLTGDFNYEPYGSDANSDPERRKANFNNGMITLANLAKEFPAIGMILQSPEAAKAVVEQWAREYDIRDRQPFLGAFNAMQPALPTGASPAGGPAPMGAPSGQPPAPGGPPGLPPQIAALLSSAGTPPPTGGIPGIA